MAKFPLARTPESKHNRSAPDATGLQLQHTAPESSFGPDPEVQADLAFWSAQYQRQITLAELEEITTNLLGLAKFLIADEIEKSKARTSPRA